MCFAIRLKNTVLDNDLFLIKMIVDKIGRKYMRHSAAHVCTPRLHTFKSCRRFPSWSATEQHESRALSQHRLVHSTPPTVNENKHNSLRLFCSAAYWIGINLYVRPFVSSRGS